MSSSSENRTEQSVTFEPVVCRDFLRNVCNRGRRCKFFHPPPAECEKIRRSERIFCHDFQNSVCRRVGCKFLHYSREDEEFFRLFGYLPDESEETKDRSSVTATKEQPPICKDFLNGACSRGSSCKYRHISNNLDDKSQQHCSQEYSVPFSDNPSEETQVSDFSSSHLSVMSDNAFNPSACLAQSTSMAFSAPDFIDHTCLHHPSVLNTSVIAPSDSVLTPVKDLYLSNGTVPTPVVGVIDHVSLPVSNIRHAVYAHPSGLGTFGPLVSVSSTTQHVPCSSVLAVVAESQHPTVMQHPTTSQTTYHLLPSNSTQIQQHLLSTGSAASSAPALLTIPMPPYPCSTGGVIGTHVSVTCTAAQHPALLPTVLSANRTLTTTPTPCYSSYNLLQLTPSSAVEPRLNNQQADPDTKTTSASTTAVLAAAAAAGYLAQHLPVMTGGSVVCPGTSCLSADNSTNNLLAVHCRAHMDSMKEDSRDSAVLATSIPAVSVAAAAAVAAAKAFASCANTESSDQSSHSLGNAQQSSSSALGPDGNETTGTHAACESSEVNNRTGLFSGSASSPNAHFMHRSQQNEEQAKTAAAVAAAACIGAMFSQPLSDARRGSSVAAMLDDFIHNHQQVNQSSSSAEHLDGRRVATHRLPNECARNPVADNSTSVESKQPAEAYHDSTFPGSTHQTANTSNTEDKNRPPGRSDEHPGMTSGYHGRPLLTFSKTPAWSSVATTVASAAQAAAAAAAAATAAVTHSAKFFQINRKRKTSQSLSNNMDSTSTDNVYALQPDTLASEHSLPHTSSTAAAASSSEPDRTTLSPNTAVTMTSAAAAAAMAAAAASAAAANQHIFEAKKSAFSGHTECACPDQTAHTISPENFYHVSDSMPHDQGGFSADKRCSGPYNLARRRYPHPRFRSKAALLRPSLEADDDHGLSDDDLDGPISISPSSDISPPYNAPLDQNEDGFRAAFGDSLDESRPEFRDTNAWDLHDTQTYSKFRHLSQKRESFDDDSEIRTQTLCAEFAARGIHKGHANPSGDVSFEHVSRALWKRCSDFIGSPNDAISSRIQGRAYSASALSRKVAPSLKVLFRCNSAPILTSTQQPSSSHDPVAHELMAHFSQDPGTKSQCGIFDTRGTSVSLSKRLELRRKHASHSRDSRILHNLRKLSMVKSKMFVAENCSRVSHAGRLKGNTSPDSVLTEDYSGQDDDLEYLDTEDGDDDAYEQQRDRMLPHKKSSNRRRTKFAVGHRLASANLSALAYVSRAMRRQPPALKAENARLRRKLSDLMRQRADLRVANEILLEQNARLRHSSKRASAAAAQMAKRSGKIVQPHHSQCLQSVSQTVGVPVYHSAEMHNFQSVNPSLTSTNGSVMASSRDPNTTALHGVYVSSPTASNNQQTLQAVATHAIFPSAVVASAVVPGTIALSSHQSLAALQIQNPTDPLASTTVSTQPALVREQLTEQHLVGIPGYYQHQLHHSMGSIPVSISSMSPNLAAVSSTLQLCHYPVPSSSGTPFSTHRPTAVTPGVVPVGAPSAVTLLVGQPATAYATIHSHLSPNLQMPNNVKADPSPANLTTISPIPYMYQSPSSSASIAPGVPCSSYPKPDTQILSSACQTAQERPIVFRDTRFKAS